MELDAMLSNLPIIIRIFRRKKVTKKRHKQLDINKKKKKHFIINILYILLLLYYKLAYRFFELNLQSGYAH
jgi:hypothetical protein